jgi:hypothetical protein
MRERMFQIINILSSPGDPLTVRLKGSLAIFALHATWFVLREESVTDAERQEAGVQVALELVEPDVESPDHPQGGGAGISHAAAR